MTCSLGRQRLGPRFAHDAMRTTPDSRRLRARERAMTTMAATGLQQERRGVNLVFGSESPIAGLVRTCERIARSDATVLLTGETGTGKEVFARMIHEQSARAGRPIIPVNCG